MGQRGGASAQQRHSEEGECVCLKWIPKCADGHTDCEGHKLRMTHRKANLTLQLVIHAWGDPRIGLER